MRRQALAATGVTGRGRTGAATASGSRPVGLYCEHGGRGNPQCVEAMDLLDTWAEQAGLWAMVEAGPIALARLDDEDVPRLRELMAKYRDLPMDLADAALVHVAGRGGHRQIFTLDRRDLEVYRVAGRERLTILCRCLRDPPVVRSWGPGKPLRGDRH